MATIPLSQPWEAESRFKMIDVGGKAISLRRAIAQGRIRLSPAAFDAIAHRTNPKGDVLALAEAAGLVMAKKTADIIPLCHPLPLDQVRLGFELEPSAHSVLVTCEARATAKTGVEMEAIAGVQGALLTIYDLSKAVSPEITITDIRLNLKEGGKSGRWIHPEASEPTRAQSEPLHGARVAVLNIEDKQTKLDEQTLLTELRSLGAELTCHLRVAREPKEIANAIGKAIDELKSHALLIVGGSGGHDRDCVPEVLKALGAQTMPRLSTALGLDDSSRGGRSLLNRSEVSLFRGSLILPVVDEAQALHLMTHSFSRVLPGLLAELRNERVDA